MSVKIVFRGKVIQDCSLNNEDQESPFCVFTVATKGNENDKYENIFINVIGYKDQSIEYFNTIKKDMEVKVVGRLDAGEDGSPRICKSNAEKSKGIFDVIAWKVKARPPLDTVLEKLESK